MVADLVGSQTNDSESEPSPASFRALEGLLGAFELVLFATFSIHKLGKFVSAFPHPSSWATNAFCRNLNQFDLDRHPFLRLTYGSIYPPG